jgi:hypothetical protein
MLVCDQLSADECRSRSWQLVDDLSIRGFVAASKEGYELSGGRAAHSIRGGFGIADECDSLS